ncbi:hypothetical protein GLAREA_03676 [Glarea lozoyensis ATCC 20868]|uniref:Uncharacterized protein n=1 Tax=Glarea lozoyensis (strain ATCC 20868 / MF5171) TaxID=1116229 RepID=S3D0M3_GLAL2|nr:uncharacterized protein GLAREA_03676 [Glarea lozoyensis ATCC 20868]EPE30709.1 hypothetical protein GLAREA_03676 [Glarea lozoyensis ATCC 20868]
MNTTEAKAMSNPPLPDPSLPTPSSSPVLQNITNDAQKPHPHPTNTTVPSQPAPETSIPQPATNPPTSLPLPPQIPRIRTPIEHQAMFARPPSLVTYPESTSGVSSLTSSRAPSPFPQTGSQEPTVATRSPANGFAHPASFLKDTEPTGPLRKRIRKKGANSKNGTRESTSGVDEVPELEEEVSVYVPTVREIDVARRMDERERDLEVVLRGSVVSRKRGLNDDDDPQESLRLLKVAKKVFAKSVTDQPVQPPVATHRRELSGSHRLTPTFQDLALGHIRVLAADQEFEIEKFGVFVAQTPNCSFCLYACNYGISNAKMCLPADASGVFCETCYASCDNFREATFRKPPLTDTPYIYKDFWKEHCAATGIPLKETVIEQGLKQIARTYQLSKPAPHNTTSQIDKQDIEPFHGLHFCRGNPWTQVDLKKVMICRPCVEEKLTIIKHRHTQFIRIEVSPEKDGFGNVVWDPKQKQCMVCPGLATEKCKSCPLRLCDVCEVYLRRLGKGWLDNLFYHYNRSHLRNDAFILRGDGGGF